MTDVVFSGRTGRLSNRETSSERRLVSRLSGEGEWLVDAGFRERTYQGDVFFASAAAVTLPVNANNLVSVFGIYNPPSSGKILEIIDTDIGITGGGNGTHMVYLSGVTDHHIRDADMIDHIVRLVEAKAAEIEAAALAPLSDAAE